jgi:hypothetical protein
MLTIIIVALVALITGLAVGWALRGSRPWCPDCGTPMTCTTCPHPVAGRLPRDRIARRSDG